MAAVIIRNKEYNDVESIKQQLVNAHTFLTGPEKVKLAKDLVINFPEDLPAFIATLLDSPILKRISFDRDSPVHNSLLDELVKVYIAHHDGARFAHAYEMNKKPNSLKFLDNFRLSPESRQMLDKLNGNSPGIMTDYLSRVILPSVLPNELHLKDHVRDSIAAKLIANSDHVHAQKTSYDKELERLEGITLRKDLIQNFVLDAANEVLQQVKQFHGKGDDTLLTDILRHTNELLTGSMTPLDYAKEMGKLENERQKLISIGKAFDIKSHILNNLKHPMTWLCITAAVGLIVGISVATGGIGAAIVGALLVVALIAQAFSHTSLAKAERNKKVLDVTSKLSSEANKAGTISRNFFFAHREASPHPQDETPKKNEKPKTPH